VARDESDRRLTAIYNARRAGDSEELLRALRDPEFRDYAARSLAHIGDRSAAPAIAVLLDANDWRARVGAVRALGELHATEFAPRLISLVESDPESVVREWAVAALGQIGEEGALPILARCLNSGEPRMRRAAAFGLGEMGGADAANLLRDAMRRENLWRRGAYRRALRRAKSTRRNPPRDSTFRP
jgi:HEAT repeat protein